MYIQCYPLECQDLALARAIVLLYLQYYCTLYLCYKPQAASSFLLIPMMFSNLHRTIAAAVAAGLLFAVRIEALSISNANDGVGSASRRDVLIGASSAAAALSLSPFTSTSAWAAGSKNAAPIAILGASGRTGALCVLSCLRRGLPVKALTRSGNFPPKKIDLKAVGFDGDLANNPLLTVGACDVKDTESLEKSLAGCRAVIYAASASKSGGNSKDIDGDGVINSGNACLKNKVGRYVVLSSGSTTRPNSMGFKFTEMAVAGIMTQKRLGEVGVANAFNNGGKSSSYTIIRPGGLDEPKQNIIQGPSALELTQGDVLAGFVSRADVAEVAVEVALSNASNLKNTAFELYYQNKVVPVDKKYKKYSQPDTPIERLHGETYEELFRGVVPNYDYLVDA